MDIRRKKNDLNFKQGIYEEGKEENDLKALEDVNGMQHMCCLFKQSEVIF